MALPRRFWSRPAIEAAPELLNKMLVVGGPGGSRSGRIVEVEAYGGPGDSASHGFRGPTKRNAVMFGPPGHMYVYFTYGMHWCANVVCGPAGVAEAVLIRALIPVGGIDEMRADRSRVGHPADRDLCRGPARLTQALSITGVDNGIDLCGDARVQVVSDGVGPPARPERGPRVGVGQAAEVPWRFWVPGERHVSTFRPRRRAPSPNAVT